MKIYNGQWHQCGSVKLTDICPHCGTKSAFEKFGEDSIFTNLWVVGQRICPNMDCRGHIFVIYDRKSHKVQVTYPPRRIDFDISNIPERIITVFTEAITCHANCCYVASAIMVRRTLEEICVNRGAVGKNLKQKINDLGSKIILPKELIEAFDELRLLGNDAAHIEAKTFESISESEVFVAIEFTKEILKGLFQYSSLLEKIRNLKKDAKQNQDTTE